MSNIRTTKVRRSNNGGSFLPAILLVIVVSLLSIGIASIWQANQKQETPQRLISSSSSQSEDLNPSGSSSESQSQSQTSSTAESDSSSQPIFKVTGEVAESERVRSEYFDDAMFVGDSITTGIKLYDVMANTTVVAATGINLDNVMTKKAIESDTGETLTILEEMAKHNPKKIYIMLGANGVAFLSPEKTAEYYGKLIDSIKAQHSNATIYVQSILPINETKFKTKYQGDVTNKKIDATNEAIKTAASARNVYYLNVAETFKDESGGMPADSTPDGLHFSSEQYIKWFDYLKTHTVK